MATHPRKGRFAGLLYLLVVALSGFAYYVRTHLTARNADIRSTLALIRGSESLYRFGLVSDLAGQALQVLLVLQFYELFRQERHARLMAVLGLIPVAIACLNLQNQGAVLEGLAAAQPPTSFFFVFELQRQGVLIAQLFWGLWLLPLAHLAVSAGSAPLPVAALLVAAASGYLLDSTAHFLAHRSHVSGGTVSLAAYTFVGELVFIAWLLLNRGRKEKTLPGYGL